MAVAQHIDTEYVLPFASVGMESVARVGGKNASLGEMIRSLSSAGVAVPDGFATTAAAYRAFLSDNGMDARIRALLADYREGSTSLSVTGAALRELVVSGEFPSDIAAAVVRSCRALGREGEPAPAVAVRSSATAEDLPEASFAGAQETFLNVTGDDALLDACRRCFASLFTDRAIAYREAKDFDHAAVALSVGVQLMVRSDIGGSGVMFSIDTESGFPRAAIISAAWGLGETVVQGTVDPDRYAVFTPLLDPPGLHPIIERTRGAKERKLVYGRGAGASTRLVETTPRERASFVLDDAEILQLARWAVLVAEHYGRPMDMEWARDGITHELFLVQARPETVQSAKTGNRFSVQRLTEAARPIVSGSAIGDRIAVGTACVIRSTADIAAFRDGAILVTEMTDPDWVSVMARASGIITEHGGSTSHAAIVSRELGIPAVVGTGDATSVLQEGQLVTLSCAEGDEGHVYDGRLAFETEHIDLDEVPRTRTRMLLNVASPAAAFRWWRLPAHGVGLARMEFIINDLIGIHPMALVHPERVTDEGEIERIAALTQHVADPREFFIDTLARGIAKLAAPHHPHPVIVRMSDFKTNEYAHLLGGSAFEEVEENPMIGFRGASRYYDPRYREGFALECAALKRVREHIGFSNVAIMVPFCRTPVEADRVITELARNGLIRGENGLRVLMMCEVPSNVVLADRFASRFDGFSIGSNDLTQLVLGIDRDSGHLAPLFDENDEAVLRMISQAIRAAHEAGISVGICGQAPSDSPAFAAFLVEQGIDSISLNPDSFLRTVQVVARAERAHPTPPEGEPGSATASDRRDHEADLHRS